MLKYRKNNHSLTNSRSKKMSEDLSNIKIIAFDFDGTIINNTHSGINKFRFILERLGLLTKDGGSDVEKWKKLERIIQENWGKTFMELCEIVALNANATPEQAAQFIEIEKEYSFIPSYDEQIVSTLWDLRAHDYLTALLTNRTTSSLKSAAEAIKLDLNCFDHIQTVEDSYFNKPDGRVFMPLRKWARKKDLSTREIIYIGDTLYDLLATMTSQPRIKFVGIVSGATNPSDYYSNGVINVIDYFGLADFLRMTFLKKTA